MTSKQYVSVRQTRAGGSTAGRLVQLFNEDVLGRVTARTTSSRTLNYLHSLSTNSRYLTVDLPCGARFYRLC